MLKTSFKNLSFKMTSCFKEMFMKFQNYRAAYLVGPKNFKGQSHWCCLMGDWMQKTKVLTTAIRKRGKNAFYST